MGSELISAADKAELPIGYLGLSKVREIAE